MPTPIFPTVRGRRRAKLVQLPRQPDVLAYANFVSHWVGVGAAEVDPAYDVALWDAIRDRPTPDWWATRRAQERKWRASLWAERAHATLLAAWDEPHRAYHTGRHLQACLAAFDTVAHAFVDPHGAALALWYHDAVYDPRRTDNEAESAALARRHLAAAGARPEAVARIEALIDATRHAAEPEAPDARLVLDIDLGILGAPRERYAQYEDEVRREYAFVPHAIFGPARAAILRRFLERPIYRTPHFAGREAAARENLAWAIARLESPA